MPGDGSSSKKGAIAALLVIVAAGFTYAQYKRVTPDPSINNGHTGEDFGPPREQITQEQRQEQFTAIAAEAKITPEQQKQLQQAFEKSGGDFRQMRTVAEDILTTEQRQAVRESFQSRMASRMAERDAKMRAAMTDAEFEKYQQRREERMRRWREGRGGQGGQRGPGGPGGPGSANGGNR